MVYFDQILLTYTVVYCSNFQEGGHRKRVENNRGITLLSLVGNCLLIFLTIG